MSLWRRDLRLPPIAGPDAIAVALLAALVAGVFHDVTLGGRVLYERDAHLYLYPHLESLVQVVSQGSWPLWNPYFAFGEPMLANPQFQVFYPPTWLNVAARPWTWYTASVLAHLTFSSAGVYALARRLGASRLAAWVGGAAWMLSGPLLSLVNNHHHLTGAAWMPWVLLAADRAFASPTSTRRFILFAAAFAIQIVAGSPDTCAMTAVLCGLDFLRHLQWGSPWSAADAKKLAAAAGATALALGLSAAQWLPTMVVAARSTRTDLPDSLRTYWSMHPANILQAVVPISFHELPLSTGARAALFESREPFLMSLYLGVGALVLVATAVVAGRPPARALALVALAAVLLAMGRHGVFYPALATVLPPVRMFRYPVKAMLAAALCWALLAAIGLDAWRGVTELPRGRRRAAWTMAAVALAIGVALALLAMGHVPGWLAPTFTTDPTAPPLTLLLAPALRRTVPAMLLALAILAASLAIRIRPALGVRVMGLAAVADLALAHAGLNRTCPPAMMEARPPALAYVKWDGSRVYSYDEFIPNHGAQPPTHAPYTLAQPSPDDRAIAALGLRMALYPSILGLWRVENSYDFDQLQLFPRPLGALPAFLRIVEGTPTHLRLLRMGAVSRVFALHSGGLEALTPITTLPTLFTEPLRVFAVPDPLPRAYMVAGARIADGPAAWAAVADPAFDPSREVILTEGREDPPGPFDGRLRVLERKPDRLTFETEGNRPGYLVMVDAYDAGWRARVDGVPTPVMRANVGFRAIAVPAGRHLVTSTYRPGAVGAGLAVSVLSALGALGLWRSARAGAATLDPAATPRTGAWA